MRTSTQKLKNQDMTQTKRDSHFPGIAFMGKKDDVPPLLAPPSMSLPAPHHLFFTTE